MNFQDPNRSLQKKKHKGPKNTLGRLEKHFLSQLKCAPTIKNIREYTSPQDRYVPHEQDRWTYGAGAQRSSGTRAA